MVDRRVCKGLAVETAISRRFVGMQRRASLDPLMNYPVDPVRIYSVNRHCNGFAALLAHSENCCFADSPATGMQFFAGVFVALFAADESLINLHGAAQLGEVVFARLAEPAENEPSRLLRDANLLGKLHAADALAGGDDEVHRIEPFVQRHVRPLEDGSGADREVELAWVTAVIAALARRDPIKRSARRADRAVRPEPRFQAEPGALLIGEHLEKLEGADGGLAHRLTLGLCADYSAGGLGSQIYNSLILLTSKFRPLHGSFACHF